MTTPRFEFLDHTADVQAECRADDFPGLLEAAARALYALTLRDVRAGHDETRTFEITGESREEILVRWLQELIFLLDVERFVATAFVFSAAEKHGVTATLRGYHCEPADRAEEVKSATYHEIEVRETDQGLVARVIFDL